MNINNSINNLINSNIIDSINELINYFNYKKQIQILLREKLINQLKQIDQESKHSKDLIKMVNQKITNCDYKLQKLSIIEQNIKTLNQDLICKDLEWMVRNHLKK